MRIVFLGSPSAAVPSLEALMAAGHDVALVVTQPDRRRGRGGDVIPTPVKAAAIEHGIPTTHVVDDALGVGAELGVVVAFGKIIKGHVLDALPMINVHFSLLPRWRGAAPVERAILEGDRETGVCIMRVDVGLDTGDVFAVERIAIDDDVTADELTARLADHGARLLVQTLETGLTGATPQQGEPTYAAKISPDDLHLDLTRPAEELVRVTRLGRAWTTVGGKRLIVWRARVDESGAFEPIEVQPEGKARMSYADWVRGAGAGLQLGS
ncbi:MAG TPA: methionyl-tRNA formyltransferase [Acidimicrobiales bacterium]|nr:methionyl-tRNA formyltransferase [Acidimicrobiales bacterium]